MTASGDSIPTPLDHAAASSIARPRLPAALLVSAIFVLAVNLRMGIASVGPVLPQLVHDLDVTLVYASFLTAVPVVMRGIASPFGARLGARFGLERTVVGAIAIVGVATAVRYWATSAIMLVLSAALLGCGIAAGNTMLPAVVRRYFPAHGALMTGHVHRRNQHGRGPRRIRYAPARAEPVAHVPGSAGDLGRDGHPGAGTVAPGGESVAAPADRSQGIYAPTVASSVDSRRIVRPPVDRALRSPYLARASV